MELGAKGSIVAEASRDGTHKVKPQRTLIDGARTCDIASGAPSVRKRPACTVALIKLARLAQAISEPSIAGANQASDQPQPYQRIRLRWKALDFCTNSREVKPSIGS